MKLHIRRLEDSNEVIYEWVDQNVRFGLWFDEEECDWTFSSKPPVDWICAGDKMTVEQLRELHQLIGGLLERESA